MKKIIFLFIVLVTGMTLLACGIKNAPSQKVLPGAVNPQSENNAKQIWQMEWEKAMKAGQRESKVVIYTTYSGEARNALRESFKRKYGIEAEFMTGRGAELRTRLFNERKAGIYAADIFLMGASGMVIDLKPSGVLDPLDTRLILPEVLNPKVWWGGEIKWVDEGHHVFPFAAYVSGVPAFNSKSAGAEEIKSWNDLLAPRWKGRISLSDPTTTGSSLAWFFMMGKYVLSLDYMRKLAGQELVIIRDQRLQAEWLAHAKYPVAIGIPPYAVSEFIRAGSPIVFKTLSEGAFVTAGAGTFALINRAPHPGAAKVFINWLLTREGQTLISEINHTQSARIDTPIDFLNPVEVRQENAKYVDERIEANQIEQQQWQEIAKEIFGALLK